MEQGLIGVIVPVYKVEKYVAECIESILAQTYTNFRLILVDDGSPDDAGKICDEYATKDQCITVIHQENAGVTRARARGVEEADDCEFITFVDGDDKLEKTALEKYISLMDENTDIVLNSTYFTEKECQISISPFYKFKEPRVSIKNFRGKMISTKGGMPWGRLFRRNIVTSFVFDIPREVFYGEDAIMNIRIAFNTNKDVAIINEPLYFYRQNTEGVCKTFIHTHEYEEILRQHILQSIPKEYLKCHYDDYLWRRLWLWTLQFNEIINTPKWANTKFHTQLIKDIKSNRYNLQINTFDRLLILNSNPISRFIIISIRKCLSLIKRLTCKKPKSE